MAGGKVCKSCGTDVSNKKRFKDAAGLYLCEACGDKEMDVEAARKDEARMNASAGPSAIEKFKALPKAKQAVYATMTLIGVAVLAIAAIWLQNKIFGD